METNNENRKVFIEKKLWPFLVSFSGAVVMLLAFFIPSIQDQWDRYEARKVIGQYVSLGDEFIEEEHYKMAEEAYTKAFDLSEGKRLDIDIKRLNAKVNRINEDPAWGSEAPDDLEEVDFQLLLHLQKDKSKQRDRVYTLNSYAIFLASQGRLKEAHQAFDEALKLDPKEVHTYINLGNLLDEEGNFIDAEKSYRHAISLDSVNSRAHYNLGLLLYEQKKIAEAQAEFKTARRLDPDDFEDTNTLDEIDRND